MKHKTHQILRIFFVSAATLAVGLSVISPYASAAPGGTGAQKNGTGTGQQTYKDQPDPAATAGASDCNKDKNCEKIFTQYLLPAINLLSAAVGVAAVGMIIFGGIEFSSSGGDPQQVASAKSHITNAVIALVAFLFLWAFLNFIIPGGLLNAST